MVDVTRRPDGQRQAATASAASSTSASVSVRQSSRSLSSRTIPITGGSPRRSGLGQGERERAGPALDLGQREGAAARAGDGLLDGAAGELGQALGAGAHGRGGLVEHAQHGQVAAAGAVGGQGALERRQRQLVGAERALERVAAHALDQLGAPGGDAGLRPAQELVAGERDDVRRPASMLAATVGSSPVSTSAPEPRSSTSASPCRSARRARSRALRLLREADHAEVRLVHAQERGRPLGERPLVVGEPRPVGRPHLDERGARAGEHVGDAEAVADLDQLPAGDDHLATLGQRRQREQHRGRVVVDDERCLGAGQLPQHRRDVVLPGAAAPALDVVLEVRVAGADLARRARGRHSASGARPRFVWTTTPVAFSTRLRLGRRRASSSARVRSTRSPAGKPAFTSSRARSRAARAEARTSGRPCCSTSASSSFRPSSSSTAGSSRSGFEGLTKAHDSDRVSR